RPGSCQTDVLGDHLSKRGELHGLEDVIAETGPAVLDLPLKREAQESDDRDLGAMGATANLAAQLGALHVGQLSVQHDEVGRGLLEGLEGGLAVDGLVHGVALVRESGYQPLSADRVGLDQENRAHRARYPAITAGRARVFSGLGM